MKLWLVSGYDNEFTTMAPCLDADTKYIFNSVFQVEEAVAVLDAHKEKEKRSRKQSENGE